MGLPFSKPELVKVKAIAASSGAVGRCLPRNDLSKPTRQRKPRFRIPHARSWRAPAEAPPSEQQEEDADAKAEQNRAALNGLISTVAFAQSPDVPLRGQDRNPKMPPPD